MAQLNKDLLVTTARQIVAEEGLAALSLRRLGARLEVSAPALYAHFSDKQALLRAIAEVEFLELFARFEQVSGLTAIERVRAHCMAYVSHARQNPELFRLMFLFAPNVDPTTQLPESARLGAANLVFEAALNAVAEAVREQELNSDDVLLTALAFWAASHGLANVILLGPLLGEELQDRLVHELVERLVSSYL